MSKHPPIQRPRTAVYIKNGQILRSDAAREAKAIQDAEDVVREVLNDPEYKLKGPRSGSGSRDGKRSRSSSADEKRSRTGSGDSKRLRSGGGDGKRSDDAGGGRSGSPIIEGKRSRSSSKGLKKRESASVATQYAKCGVRQGSDWNISKDKGFEEATSRDYKRYTQRDSKEWSNNQTERAKSPRPAVKGDLTTGAKPSIARVRPVQPQGAKASEPVHVVARDKEVEKSCDMSFSGGRAEVLNQPYEMENRKWEKGKRNPEVVGVKEEYRTKAEYVHSQGEVKALNARVQGVKVEVAAEATASQSHTRVSALEAQVTGVETGAVARAQHHHTDLATKTGCVSVTGVNAKATAEAKVSTGVAVDAGNVTATGVGPVGVNVNVDARSGLAVGNVQCGVHGKTGVSVSTRPSAFNVSATLGPPGLSLGLGMNLGVPFMGGAASDETIGLAMVEAGSSENDPPGAKDVSKSGGGGTDDVDMGTSMSEVPGKSSTEASESQKTGTGTNDTRSLGGYRGHDLGAGNSGAGITSNAGDRYEGGGHQKEGASTSSYSFSQGRDNWEVSGTRGSGTSDAMNYSGGKYAGRDDVGHRRDMAQRTGTPTASNGLGYNRPQISQANGAHLGQGYWMTYKENGDRYWVSLDHDEDDFELLFSDDKRPEASSNEAHSVETSQSGNRARGRCTPAGEGVLPRLPQSPYLVSQAAAAEGSSSYFGDPNSDIIYNRLHGRKTPTTRRENGKDKSPKGGKKPQKRGFGDRFDQMVVGIVERELDGKLKQTDETRKPNPKSEKTPLDREAIKARLISNLKPKLHKPELNKVNNSGADDKHGHTSDKVGSSSGASGTGNTGGNKATGSDEQVRPVSVKKKGKPFGDHKNIHGFHTLGTSSGKPLKQLGKNIVGFGN